MILLLGAVIFHGPGKRPVLRIRLVIRVNGAAQTAGAPGKGTLKPKGVSSDEAVSGGNRLLAFEDAVHLFHVGDIDHAAVH